MKLYLLSLMMLLPLSAVAQDPVLESPTFEQALRSVEPLGGMVLTGIETELQNNSYHRGANPMVVSWKGSHFKASITYTDVAHASVVKVVFDGTLDQWIVIDSIHVEHKRKWADD